MLPYAVYDLGQRHINERPFYYVKDLTGNIRRIVDSNGKCVIKYDYDAWGRVINTEYSDTLYTIWENAYFNAYSIGQLNSLIYKDYYYDKDLELYYLQTRYYDPSTCRFISPDHPDYLDYESINGLNLYAYCLNSPVMYADPTGHFVFTTAMLVGLIIGATVGAAIGFGTVAYTDYQDDGQIFNGSVKWYEYVGGTVTGAVLGAGVGGIIGAGGAVLTSAISSFTNKFISDLFAYTLTGTSFGTWEDYAVAFIFGGLIKGLGMEKIVEIAYDVLIRPAINQAVKIGTNRTETFSVEKYAYDMVTRGLTTLAPSPWKEFYRGGFKSIWDLYKRGYFA